MFSEAAKTLLDFLKLAPRYLIALGVIAAILLFASEEFLNLVGVLGFVEESRSILGLTLIVAGALFAVSVAAEGISIIKILWRKRGFYRRVAVRLNRLTEDEKQILLFYIAKQTRANVLRYDDGVVQGLVSDGVFYQSSLLGNMLAGFAHNISDFSRDYLNAYPHVFQGTTHAYRTDKRESHWQPRSSTLQLSGLAYCQRFTLFVSQMQHICTSHGRH